MKTLKRITALALAAATALSLLASAPVQAAARVKKETRYEWRDGKWQLESSSSYTYDSKGRITKQVNVERVIDSYDENYNPVYTNVTSEYRTKYDSKGRIILDTWKRDGKENYREETSYTSKKTTRKVYEDGKLSRVRITTRTTNGQIKKEEERDGSNKLKSTNHYTYDAKGHVTKVVTKNASGKTTGTRTIKYTYKGNRITKSVETVAGRTIETVYYSTGQTKSWKYTAADGSYFSEDRYDSKGNQTYSYEKTNYSEQKSTFKNGREATRKTTWKYDGGNTEKHSYTFSYTIKSGKVTEKVMKEGTKKIQKITYTY